MTSASDDDHLYVTAQFGGRTWLASGRLIAKAWSPAVVR